MRITFPAMKGMMGSRQYYTAMIKLAVVPKLFQFEDWSAIPPEHRAQRVLQKSRVPEITAYMTDNPDDYVFSALTASYEGEAKFRSFNEDNQNIGELELSMDAKFVINDGQHRRAAIEEAIKQNSEIGEHSIAVVLFPCEDLDRMQQMFSDLNRTARSTAKSLNILFNHRDLMAQVTLAVTECVPIFRKLVDKDRASLPLKSPKLFTLSALHDSTTALLESVTEDNQKSKEESAVAYWAAVALNFPEWKMAYDGDIKPMEIRAEYLHSHSVVIWALGSVGRTLLMHHPLDWKTKIEKLSSIDWARSNKEWQHIAMMGSQILNRRQNREDTAAFIKQKIGLPLTPNEARSLKAIAEPNSTIDDLISLAN
jgi:DNA sulfur modification protein DndB